MTIWYQPAFKMALEGVSKRVKFCVFKKMSSLCKADGVRVCAAFAPIAQLVEHLICNQGVGSSSLSGGTT